MSLSSNTLTLEEIREELLDLETPTERLEWLIEFGQTLPAFPDSARIEENRVLGCQSLVWLVSKQVDGHMQFLATSDAPMVRGLIAILLSVYSQKTPDEILDFRVDDYFNTLQLRQFITPMRSNGLHAMIVRIRELAAEAKGIAPQSYTSGVAASKVPRPTERSAERTSQRSIERTTERSKERTTEQARAASIDDPSLAQKPSIQRTSDGQPGSGRDRNHVPTIATCRFDFPILDRKLPNGEPLIYLDNAASSQRPQSVIDAMSDAYRVHYSNVHRSGHALASETTIAMERAREALRDFIHAEQTSEIIFTSGTTAAINLVARTWGDAHLQRGDEILLTEMEHHSNIVPWQQLAERTGAIIRWLPIRDDYQLDLDRLPECLSSRTKLMAVTAVSNVLGTINPIRKIADQVHAAGGILLVDAAQAVPHAGCDVQSMDADFLAFSGHKMLGPNGIGVLYGKMSHLIDMPPFLGGGSMIKSVERHAYTAADVPHRFEAGTPPIVEAIAMRPAVEYLQAITGPAILAHERALNTRAEEGLADVPGLRIFGPPVEQRSGILSFVVDRVHPIELEKFLDLNGIAVRVGHHCAMPLHERLGVSSTCRASFYFYNTLEEVDRFTEVLRAAVKTYLKVID